MRRESVGTIGPYLDNGSSLVEVGRDQTERRSGVAALQRNEPLERGANAYVRGETVRGLGRNAHDLAANERLSRTL